MSADVAINFEKGPTVIPIEGGTVGIYAKPYSGFSPHETISFGAAGSCKEIGGHVVRFALNETADAASVATGGFSTSATSVMQYVASKENLGLRAKIQDTFAEHGCRKPDIANPYPHIKVRSFLATASMKDVGGDALVSGITFCNSGKEDDSLVMDINTGKDISDRNVFVSGHYQRHPKANLGYLLWLTSGKTINMGRDAQHDIYSSLSSRATPTGQAYIRGHKTFCSANVNGSVAAAPDMPQRMTPAQSIVLKLSSQSN